MEVEHRAPKVEMAWMGYTDGSCCGNKVSHGALPMGASGGRIRERGGDLLGGKGVRVTVSPKEAK